MQLPGGSAVSHHQDAGLRCTVRDLKMTKNRVVSGKSDTTRKVGIRNNWDSVAHSKKSMPSGTSAEPRSERPSGCCGPPGLHRILYRPASIPVVDQHIPTGSSPLKCQGLQLPFYCSSSTPLDRREGAVDDEVRAGGEGRGVAGEIDGDGLELSRLAEAAEG